MLLSFLFDKFFALFCSSRPYKWSQKFCLWSCTLEQILAYSINNFLIPCYRSKLLRVMLNTFCSNITVIPGITAILGARRGPRAPVVSWWGSPWRGSPWRRSSGWPPSRRSPSVARRPDAYRVPRGSGTWRAWAPSSSVRCWGRSPSRSDKLTCSLQIHLTSIMFLD